MAADANGHCDCKIPVVFDPEAAENDVGMSRGGNQAKSLASCRAK